MRLLIIRLPAYLFGTSRGGVGCGVWGRLEGRLAAVEGLSMQNLASELRRIPILERVMNLGESRIEMRISRSA
jgi:hypothetical protein